MAIGYATTGALDSEASGNPGAVQYRFDQLPFEILNHSVNPDCTAPTIQNIMGQYRIYVFVSAAF